MTRKRKDELIIKALELMSNLQYKLLTSIDVLNQSIPREDYDNWSKAYYIIRKLNGDINDD